MQPQEPQESVVEADQPDAAGPVACARIKRDPATKKREREARRERQYEMKKEMRKEKRVLERAKKRTACQEQQQQQLLLLPESGTAEMSSQALSKQERKDIFRRTCEASGVSVVIDMQWNHLMKPSELMSAVRQVQSCYSRNKASSHPLMMWVTSWTDDVFQKLLPGSGNWGLYRRETSSLNDLVAADPALRSRVVYLTADAEEELVDVPQAGTIYVVGGFVDRNRYKNVTAVLARQLGLRMQRLPIRKEDCEGRTVMTINQVVEMMNVAMEKGSWAVAIEQVFPKRKRHCAQSTAPATVIADTDPAADVADTKSGDRSTQPPS